MMPSRVSGKPTTAREAKTRRVVASASSRPPPRAMEETAEMVGMGREESVVRVWRREERKSFVLGNKVLAILAKDNRGVR